VADALLQRDVEGVVAGRALVDPGKRIGNVGIRALRQCDAVHLDGRQGRHVVGPLRHDGRLTGGIHASADTSLRVLADLGRVEVGILTERGVISLAAHIAHRKHQVPGELSLHRESPFLDGRCEHVGIDAGGLKDRAGKTLRRTASGRRRYSSREGKPEREQRTGERFAGIEGRIGIDADGEIILQIIVNSEGGAHGPGAFAGRIPGNAGARLPQR
jgi:hypothetical protein